MMLLACAAAITVGKPIEQAGTLRVPGAMMVTVLAGEQVRKIPSGRTGRFVLDAGSYTLLTVWFTKWDDRGRLWTAEVQPIGRDSGLKITGGKTTEVQCGPPFTLDLALGDKRDRQIYMINRRDAIEPGNPGPRDLILRASCRDAYGNRVVMIHAGSSKVLPPVVRARSTDGSLVATLPFEYG